MIVGRDADTIAGELRSLLPPGPALSGPNVAALIQAFASARAILEGDVAALQNEFCPGTSVLLLQDYQDLLGPDPAGRDVGSLTNDELRALLQARWTATGGARIADIVGMGRSYGIAVTVTEPEPAICGVAKCGAATCSQHTIRFYWFCDLAEDSSGLRTQIELAAPADTIVLFRVNGEWV
ncbi:hypothetical protein [Gluconobacter japonicus]|uniref:hypothetical protein n=1 Tax=Gluconobacter japonicus TaxID=376620 RepID=UPI0039E7B9F7